MTPEERSLLERTASLAEENNKILRSVRRTSRISLGMRITYWVVILSLSFGAYFVIQPYVEAMTRALGGESATQAEPTYQEKLELFKSLF